MTEDTRTLFSNGAVAHKSLEGTVEAARFVEGRGMMVQQPIANLLDEPRGQRVSQLVFGEEFHVLDSLDGFAFGRRKSDGYVGYIIDAALTGLEPATHWVVAPATHLYPKADIKASPQVSLFFGSQVKVVGEKGAFSRIQTGHFLPTCHLMPIKARFSDPVAVADLFLGTPYLWGGINRWGLDCSGLIQTSLLACGIDCPRDSDQQLEALGENLSESDRLARGDLVFWNGHVGIMSNDETLLHANAHHMAVAYEHVSEAVARIEQSEFGQVVACKRLAGI